MKNSSAPPKSLKLSLIILFYLIGGATAKPRIDEFNLARFEQKISIFAIQNCLDETWARKVCYKLIQLKGWREAEKLMDDAQGVICTVNGACLIMGDVDFSFNFKDKSQIHIINDNGY